MRDAVVDFSIIYRDEWLVVLDKPSGLLSVPGRGAENSDNLATRVQSVLPQARVVHRLDRDTSGLMVMALDLETQRELSRQFEERTVTKHYVAIVAGVVGADEGETALAMRKDFDHPPRHMIDTIAGKPAVTRFRVLERGSDWTRLSLEPRTGRSHQLRLHMQQLGHPILGDNLYAPPEIRLRAKRLMLHAEGLSFAYVKTRDRKTFRADCPF
jgi:tRNA pseudouridine32 synthase/23S rRNA pseudouridine746 synthase